MSELNTAGFAGLGLDARLLKALEGEGYTTPTPIQIQAIPPVLAGRDLLGIAQTGTGKTAAFALPMLQRIAAMEGRPIPGSVRALVLSPTRELASQIAESFETYGRHLRLSCGTVFGGQGHARQYQMLRRGLDVLVATPGRLLDHLQQGSLTLGHVSVFVLDEADQMLDMGFVRDIRKIARFLPKARQNLFFSATMPPEIGVLAGELLFNPEKVSVAPAATTAERVSQRVIFTTPREKNVLLSALLSEDALRRVLVFTRTKHNADRVTHYLEDTGVSAAAIHGNRSQAQRERALAGFKSGAVRVLVATDIAARGIDVDAVTHVINYHLPNVPESYVHRIGRTARAGADGQAISFCDGEERAYLRDIERLTRQSIPSADMRGQFADQVAAQPAPRPARAEELGRPQHRGHGHPQKRHGDHEAGRGPRRRKAGGNKRFGQRKQAAQGSRQA